MEPGCPQREYVEKPYESYGGMNVSLRYFIQVTISRSYGTVVEKRDFAVHNFLTIANEAIESDNRFYARASYSQKSNITA